MLRRARVNVHLATMGFYLFFETFTFVWLQIVSLQSSTFRLELAFGFPCTLHWNTRLHHYKSPCDGYSVDTVSSSSSSYFSSSSSPSAPLPSAAASFVDMLSFALYLSVGHVHFSWTQPHMMFILLLVYSLSLFENVLLPPLTLFPPVVFY